MSPQSRRKRIARLVVLVVALAQDTGLTLVNEDRDLVERKKDGRFIARPVFNRELDAL